MPSCFFRVGERFSGCGFREEPKVTAARAWPKCGDLVFGFKGILKFCGGHVDEEDEEGVAGNEPGV